MDFGNHHYVARYFSIQTTSARYSAAHALLKLNFISSEQIMAITFQSLCV